MWESPGFGDFQHFHRRFRPRRDPHRAGAPSAGCGCRSAPTERQRSTRDSNDRRSAETHSSSSSKSPLLAARCAPRRRCHSPVPVSVRDTLAPTGGSKTPGSTCPGGWPSLPMANRTGGCPILRGFFAKGGRQSDPTMGFAFHAARARNEISPSPHSPAPARARPTDRRAITAPAPFLIPRGVPAPDFFLPGCGAYTAVSLDVSCPSKH